MIIMTGGRHEFEPTEIAAGRELDGGFGAGGAAAAGGDVQHERDGVCRFEGRGGKAIFVVV